MSSEEIYDVSTAPAAFVLSNAYPPKAKYALIAFLQDLRTTPSKGFLFETVSRIATSVSAPPSSGFLRYLLT